MDCSVISIRHQKEEASFSARLFPVLFYAPTPIPNPARALPASKIPIPPVRTLIDVSAPFGPEFCTLTSMRPPSLCTTILVT